MLNKACDHNDGIINTNTITKQPTVKQLPCLCPLSFNDANPPAQHLEKYIENTPVILKWLHFI